MFWKNQHPMEPVLEDLRFTDPSVPSRACCCPARPAVKVIMPPGAGRPSPVDLWLCGHHYRASVKTLLAAGATVQDLTWSDRGPEHADQVAAPA